MPTILRTGKSIDQMYENDKCDPRLKSNFTWGVAFENEAYGKSPEEEKELKRLRAESARQNRIAQGLCIQCGEINISQFQKCDRCRHKNKLSRQGLT